MTRKQKNIFLIIIYAISFIALLAVVGTCFINYQDGILMLENIKFNNGSLYKTYSNASYNLFALGIFVIVLLLGVIIRLFKENKIINIITLSVGAIVIIYSLIMLVAVKNDIFINNGELDSTTLALASTTQAIYLQVFIYSVALIGSGVCLHLNNRKEEYEK